MSEIKLAMVGGGAANICILRILIKGGVKPENIILCDSKGTLSTSRKDLEERKVELKEKWWVCQNTNPKGLTGGIDVAMEGADALISASAPGPDVIKPEWIQAMGKDPIVFTMANPIPEIWPWEAKEAGAKVVATGRSDFPNQVNNSMGFPAIFRGVLDVWAKTVTDEMCLAAGNSLAATAEKIGMSEDYIIPTMVETEAFIEEAVACGLAAIEQGIARRKLSEKELRDSAEEKITRAQREVKLMMDEGIIKKAPDK